MPAASGARTSPAAFVPFPSPWMVVLGATAAGGALQGKLGCHSRDRAGPIPFCHKGGAANPLELGVKAQPVAQFEG